MKPNHLRKRPHKLFGSIFKRALLSQPFLPGSELYASKVPRQQLFKINYEKLLSQQIRVFTLIYHPLSRELHSTQFTVLVNNFLK